MKANVAYEVFKALSDEEKGCFMTLVQNDEYNLRIVTPKNKKTKNENIFLLFYQKFYKKGILKNFFLQTL